MQRIKHHFCWVKAVTVDDGNVDGDPIGQPSGSSSMFAAPVTATATFRVLSTDELPAIAPRDLPGAGMQLLTATSSFRALVGNSLEQLSAEEVERAMVPMTATAVFKVLNDAPLPPLQFFDLELATATTPIRALTQEMFKPASSQAAMEPDTATTPIRLLLGESLPPLMFAGANFMGAWKIEADPVDQRGREVALRFKAIVGTRQDALAWRASAEGQAWASDALAISLLSFVAIGEI